MQLIDATSFWVPMRKSLGDKRREIPLDRAQDILKILAAFKDGDMRTIAKDDALGACLKTQAERALDGDLAKAEVGRGKDLADDNLFLLSVERFLTLGGASVKNGSGVFTHDDNVRGFSATPAEGEST